MSFSLIEIDPVHRIYSGHFSSFPEDIAVHGVSCRRGGVSKSPWDSLDLGLHVGDDPADVAENRRRYLAALGLDASQLVTPEQVHGEAIQRVGRSDAGRGALSYADSIAKTDALITDEPGLPLLLCFADCTPILLLDPAHRAVGIAHGGWKGTVRRIAAKTVLRMQREFGTRPENVLAAIGPSIGPCCYEVGPEVERQFQEAFSGHEAALFSHPDAAGASGRPTACSSRRLASCGSISTRRAPARPATTRISSPIAQMAARRGVSAPSSLCAADRRSCQWNHFIFLLYQLPIQTGEVS